MRLFALLICTLVLAAAAHLRAWGQVPPSALLVLHDAGRQVTLLDARDGVVLAARLLPVRLSGPPQVSPDPAQLYWGTPEGHIVQLTLPDLGIAAQVSAHVGSGTPRLALSGDGRWLLAAGAREALVQIFDATLKPVRRITIASPDGREQSGAAQVLTLAGSRSWLLALDTLRELWEISYDPAAAPIFDGLVHDYRMGEALPRSGFLGVRRTPLPAPLPDVLVPDGTRLVVGSERCPRPRPAPCACCTWTRAARSARWRSTAPRTRARRPPGSRTGTCGWRLPACTAPPRPWNYRECSPAPASRCPRTREGSSARPHPRPCGCSVPMACG